MGAVCGWTQAESAKSFWSPPPPLISSWWSDQEVQMQVKKTVWGAEVASYCKLQQTYIYTQLTVIHILIHVIHVL